MQSSSPSSTTPDAQSVLPTSTADNTSKLSEVEIDARRLKLLQEWQSLEQQETQEKQAHEVLMPESYQNHLQMTLDSWAHQKEIFETQRQVQLAKVSYKNIFESGINLRQRLRRLPLVGYLFASFKALLKLPTIRLQIDELKNQYQQMQNKLAIFEQEHYMAIKRDAILLEELNHSFRMHHAIDSLDIGKRLMGYDRLNIARQFRNIHRLIEDIQNVPDHPTHTQGQTITNEASYHQSQPQKNKLPIEDGPPYRSQYDQFYVDFEDVFRGKREDIKKRLQAYLPYLDKIPKDSKGEALTVIDVGCGRGEWLEVLDDHHIPAIGVDMNQRMIEVCKEQGFKVQCADAITMLKAQPANSLGAVTGFHIIEHLPFEKLLALFDAALHALCKGGLIIFETPNPENIKVGSCNFYHDPTHLNPIVPAVAEFMAKQRGFEQAEILRLHPYPNECLIKGDSDIAQVINKELFGAQDYAVIAYK